MKINKYDAFFGFVFCLLIAVSFCFSDFDSYASLQSQSEVGDTNLKKWFVKVNGTNIVYRDKFRFKVEYTSSSSSPYIKTGVIAPGVVFDVPVLIDATKSDVKVKYKFELGSDNNQFSIVETSPSSKVVAPGSTQQALVTIKWEGTGNVNDDLDLQGKNIDVPLIIRARQALEH